MFSITNLAQQNECTTKQVKQNRNNKYNTQWLLMLKC